jgi:integrase
LNRFSEFCDEKHVRAIDTFDVGKVEDFVRWLRSQTRTRNGASKGKRASYKTGGIKFILSTCRTAFRWAGRRRMLPPYAENPFSQFPIDRLSDREQDDGEPRLLTPDQQKAFFAKCDAWQKPIFTMLATYGMRARELTHLLVDDVDFQEGVIRIRSKPWLYWTVKTRRRREIPLIEEIAQSLRTLIGKRRAGFVFLNAGLNGDPAKSFKTPQALREHVEGIAAEISDDDMDQQMRKQKQAVATFCRSIGQIPEKRLRTEFVALAKAIGRPDLTRVHDLRHLFASRAQEAGMNPLLVQAILGHASLDMTRRYSHFSVDAKRAAMEGFVTVSRADSEHVE